MSFAQEAQKLDPTALVSLFQLDTTVVGGPVYHFTTEAKAGAAVGFGGVQFHAVPIEISGMSIQGQGSIQTPTLSISNTDLFIQEILNTFGDLEGSVVTRWRAFARHLDGGEEPDSTAFYGPDVYKIDRKSSDTPEKIEYELSALMDHQGVYVGRTVIRDTCMWRYRTFNSSTGQFNYDRSLCPYTGSSYFNANDEAVTDPAEDMPSRSLNCCRLRFGANNPMPFGGFTGIARGN
jgi:lambda family phage minor tail protein L